MKTKKPKHSLSTVPDWFNIKRYAAAAQFDIFDWWWNIHYRLSMTGLDKSFDSLREIHVHVDDEYIKEELTFYATRLEHLLAHPVRTLKEDRKRTMKDNQIDKAIVRDMTTLDVMSLAEELHKDEKYLGAWEAFNWDMSTSEPWIKERLQGKFDAMQDSASDFMNEKYPASGNFVYTEVDIHAPLDNLLESFAEWVKSKKEERGIPFHSKKMFSEIDFKKWHKYAVLPYFDLKLWADFVDAHIPDWLYVNALFGGMQGDLDGMFRKNTKPLERQVMTQACEGQLRNQGDIYY